MRRSGRLPPLRRVQRLTVSGGKNGTPTRASVPCLGKLHPLQQGRAGIRRVRDVNELARFKCAGVHSLARPGEHRLVVPLERPIVLRLLVSDNHSVSGAVHRLDDALLPGGLGSFSSPQSRWTQGERAHGNQSGATEVKSCLHINSLFCVHDSFCPPSGTFSSVPSCPHAMRPLA